MESMFKYVVIAFLVLPMLLMVLVVIVSAILVCSDLPFHHHD